MQNHIFLSYSRTDTDMMQRIKKSLVLAGFQVWTDEGIKPGTPSWTNSITTAIKLSACVVCLVSPDAAESSWVDREITYAEMLEKPIFPVLIRGTRADAIIFRLVNIQDIDISQDYSKIDQLIERLNEIIDVDAKSERAVNLPPTVPNALPQPFEWCEIPMGEARLASGGYVPDDGLSIFVDRFYMAKYPVTNAQFRIFIEQGGYKNRDFWTSTGWQYRLKQSWKQPRYWHDERFNGDTQPVVGVSWFEAIAFAKWLEGLLHQDPSMLHRRVMLPTEAQWQRAVQGDDFLAYPWGNAFDKTLTNAEHLNLKQTTSVTQFPDGASPYGVMDMIGNAWEWSASAWQDGRTEQDGDTFRVLRGGSFADYMLSSYSVSRFNHEPPNCRYNDFGFRVCVR